MIEARRISKFFSVLREDGTAEGFPALNAVSLRVEDGAFVSLLGPSGCGKSTFLEILAGLQAPSEGEVWIDGRRVLEPLPATRREMEDYRKRYRFLSPLANGLLRDAPKHDIAMIFQDYAVFPWMSALQNVTFTLKLRGVPRREREPLAREHLRTVGLAGHENKWPSQLSGGMRQRLALARALSVDPRIVLMDEPFAAVDALTREKLQDELLEIWERTRKTIVLVTHDVDEAAYLSDEIVVFSPLPGAIRNRVRVDVPRPRRRHDPALAEIRGRVVDLHRYDTFHEADYVI
jgi:NitT/TauT family transport system ATP-binding protein